jgi:hypothetical protein
MGFVDDQSDAVFKQLDYDVVLEEPVLVKPSTEAACVNTSPLFLSNFEQVRKRIIKSSCGTSTRFACLACVHVDHELL